MNTGAQSASRLIARSEKTCSRNDSVRRSGAPPTHLLQITFCSRRGYGLNVIALKDRKRLSHQVVVCAGSSNHGACAGACVFHLECLPRIPADQMVPSLVEHILGVGPEPAPNSATLGAYRCMSIISVCSCFVCDHARHSERKSRISGRERTSPMYCFMSSSS